MVKNLSVKSYFVWHTVTGKGTRRFKEGKRKILRRDVNQHESFVTCLVTG